LQNERAVLQAWFSKRKRNAEEEESRSSSGVVKRRRSRVENDGKVKSRGKQNI